MKARVDNGTISYAQLIESLPDDEAKVVDSIAQDILKSSSYLLNMYCKNRNILAKECVKFMSKYSIPETSDLAAKCVSLNMIYKGYRRLLPATYKDGLQKVRIAPKFPSRNLRNKILIFRFERLSLTRIFHFPGTSQKLCSIPGWKPSRSQIPMN